MAVYPTWEASSNEATVVGARCLTSVLIVVGKSEMSALVAEEKKTQLQSSLSRLNNGITDVKVSPIEYNNTILAQL